MQSYAKHLSYFWNSSLDKTKIKESKLYQKAADQTSAINIFGHILFSFMLVTVAATGMRMVESNTNSPHPQIKKVFTAQIAMAAEATTKAELTSQSHKQLYIKPNDAITATLTFKNTGESTWAKEKVYLKSTTTSLKFKHEFWPDTYIPAKLEEKSVLPGETGSFKIALRAPKNLGDYTGEFLLVRDNVMVDGGNASITFNVVTDPANITLPVSAVTVSNETTKLNSCTLKLNIADFTDGLDNLTCTETLKIASGGPAVRVGLFSTNDAITVINNQAWQVYDENDILLASVPANTEMRFDYIETKGEYAFDFIDKTIRTKSKLKLINFNSGIFTITSHKDVPSWNKSINYNQFKGDLEIDYYSPKEHVWLIEKLPLEEYLKGMKETSDTDPIEYQRAMTIAARTYALYHVNKFKAENSFFDLYPDERDQVYKGYVAEIVMPNRAAVVEETKGTVITQSNAVIVAYYSARSGGQTLSYKNFPYLKSVETPYSKAAGKWGHGIGIDQVDAKARADKLGWTYDKLLKYYYSGVYIEKIY